MFSSSKFSLVGLRPRGCGTPGSPGRRRWRRSARRICVAGCSRPRGRGPAGQRHVERVRRQARLQAPSPSRPRAPPRRPRSSAALTRLASWPYAAFWSFGIAADLAERRLHQPLVAEVLACSTPAGRPRPPRLSSSSPCVSRAFRSSVAMNRPSRLGLSPFRQDTTATGSRSDKLAGGSPHGRKIGCQPASAATSAAATRRAASTTAARATAASAAPAARTRAGGRRCLARVPRVQRGDRRPGQHRRAEQRHRQPRVVVVAHGRAGLQPARSAACIRASTSSPRRVCRVPASIASARPCSPTIPRKKVMPGRSLLPDQSRQQPAAHAR